jgi:ribosomal protein S17E
MITIAAIAAFLSPFLVKAGEKVAEKTVERLFESRKDLAEKFSGLFKNEFQTLGLNETSTPEEITYQLEAKPDVKEEIRQKIEANQDLVNQLTEALSKQEGRTITCKTYIEKIDHIDTANFS